MINRQALLIVLAAAAATQNADAFLAPSSHSIAATHRHQQSSTRVFEFQNAAEEHEASERIAQAYQHCIIVQEEQVEEEPEPVQLIMDIPPAPFANNNKNKPMTKTSFKNLPVKKGGNQHKEGVFSPIVVAAASVLGDKSLNKIRAKSISLHSDIIKSFVGTADSEFGKAVLRAIFDIVDTDNSGYLDKEEVAVALNLLGFKWLKDKQVSKIFERADSDGDEEISLEEFMREAPKTLKVNLVKLAKSNGGDMGLLV